jgi:hypothetical protein
MLGSYACEVDAVGTPSVLSRVLESGDEREHLHVLDA